MLAKIVLIIFIILSIFISGCSEVNDVSSHSLIQENNETFSNFTDMQLVPNSAGLLMVNSTAQIDFLLETTSVFMLISTDWCPSCQKQIPIVQELMNEYEGEIMFVNVDADKQLELAQYYNAYKIPDMSLIAAKSDEGEYL